MFYVKVITTFVFCVSDEELCHRNVLGESLDVKKKWQSGLFW